jgi:DNA modification methylase
MVEPYYDQDGITIYCGDSRDILPKLEGLDVVFTSPPYGQQRDYERAIDNWITIVPCALAAIPKRDETQIIVNLGPYHRDGEVIEYWDTLKSAMRAEGWRLFGWYVWDQGSGLPGDWGGRMAPSHEFVFHFNRKAAKLEKVVPCRSAGRKITGTGMRKANGETSEKMSHQGADVNQFKIPDSVFRVTREMRRTIDHPAVFPVKFAGEVLRAFPDGLVCDPFMGSGTTLRAAKDLGRRAIGIEIEEKYCEIAVRRLAQKVLF